MATGLQEYVDRGLITQKQNALAAKAQAAKQKYTGAASPVNNTAMIARDQAVQRGTAGGQASQLMTTQVQPQGRLIGAGANGAITPTGARPLTGWDALVQRLNNTGTAAPTTPGYDIGAGYKSALDARIAAINAGRDAEIAAQNKLISELPGQYDPMRNEAYTNDQVAQRQLRERMANLGAGAGGGTSLTFDTRRQMALQGQLGDINRQQAKAKTDAEFNIGQIGSKANAEINSATAEIEQQKQQALRDEAWKGKDYDLQKKASDLSQKQFDQAVKDGKFDQAYQLWQSKSISAAQFKKMTGIDVKRYQSSRGSKKSKSGKTGDDYANPTNNQNPKTLNAYNQAHAGYVSGQGYWNENGPWSP